jgi:hypothetical protein
LGMRETLSEFYVSSRTIIAASNLPARPKPHPKTSTFLISQRGFAHNKR